MEISFLWVSAGYVPPGLLAGGAKATGAAVSIGEFLGRRKPGLPDGGDAELGDTDGPEKKPVLKYKITTTVPIKDTDDGKADTGMALVWDKDLGRYVLVYMQTNQTSMYDNPPAGGPQQTTMNPAQQIGQGSGALIDIHTFRPDDDGDDE